VKQERAFSLYLLVCHLYSRFVIWLVICITFVKFVDTWFLQRAYHVTFVCVLEIPVLDTTIYQLELPCPIRLTNKMTDFLEYSPSWKRNPSIIRKIPRILWNSGVHYRVDNSPSLVPILSHIKPIRALATPSFKIHSNFTFQCLPMSPKRYCNLSRPIYPTLATCCSWQYEALAD
jgi:hypothetical protein